MPRAERPLAFAPRLAAARRRVPSLVDVTLDPTQEAAIELPAGRALLVLGEAGHGKTTVLLHRVARLWRTSPTPLRAAVIVPTEGLVRLVQPLLRGLGVDVEVWTFDRFAAKQARRSFRRLPRESDATPASVMRLKRAAALRSAIEEIASRAPGVIDDDVDAQRRSARPRRAERHVSRGDLQHLFGDRALMTRVARAAALPEIAVEDVLERTRVQFGFTTEREWSHVTDRARLVAVDGRPIDAGTATGHAWTVDAEDYPVLFELERARALRAGDAPVSPRTFDLLAIDEAQELAPLELALLGRSLAAGGSLVVSGDADQHTDETSSFHGWDAVMRELAAGDHAKTTLAIGYRCPPSVVSLARAVRDGGHDVDEDVRAFDDERALAADLGRALGTLLRRDRRASVVVVCRAPMTARRITTLLRLAAVPTRLVFDGRFLPRGFVQVTVVGEVKGLEFDYVVVPDASARDWPDDPAARRAMYVAITRARHQVVFACTGAPSPLLAR
ncbi:MAG: AAA family ATPase [Labilithrix sp.]|nr:AAA family ATPase [Labilithrix sp.]